MWAPSLLPPPGAGTDLNSYISTAAAPRLHTFAVRETDRFGDESPLFTLSTARKYASNMVDPLRSHRPIMTVFILAVTAFHTRPDTIGQSAG